MKDLTRMPRSVIPAAILAIITVTPTSVASAQHVTAAMAAQMRGQSTGAVGCEESAQRATKMLDVLNTNLARAREGNNETEMRAALDALQKGFAELKGRLDACRAGATSATASTAQAPTTSPRGATSGMDHSKMNMGGTKPPAASPQAAAKPSAGAVDHAAMGHTAAAGAAAAPTTVRQITSPAEAALQSFQDALQIGNREVALQWLAPEVTVTEAGAVDGSRDAYAEQHMGVDMAFLKTAKIVLVDRQVHPGGESTHVVSTSRITGRAGEIPVDVTVTERALLKKTPEGWRIVSLEWTVEPVRKESTF